MKIMKLNLKIFLLYGVLLASCDVLLARPPKIVVLPEGQTEKYQVALQKRGRFRQEIASENEAITANPVEGMTALVRLRFKSDATADCETVLIPHHNGPKGLLQGYTNLRFLQGKADEMSDEAYGQFVHQHLEQSGQSNIPDYWKPRLNSDAQLIERLKKPWTPTLQELTEAFYHHAFVPREYLLVIEIMKIPNDRLGRNADAAAMLRNDYVESVLDRRYELLSRDYCTRPSVQRGESVDNYFLTFRVYGTKGTSVRLQVKPFDLSQPINAAWSQIVVASALRMAQSLLGEAENAKNALKERLSGVEEVTYSEVTLRACEIFQIAQDFRQITDMAIGLFERYRIALRLFEAFFIQAGVDIRHLQDREGEVSLRINEGAQRVMSIANTLRGGEFGVFADHPFDREVGCLMDEESRNVRKARRLGDARGLWTAGGLARSLHRLYSDTIFKRG
jgi:hypothetical protein